MKHLPLAIIASVWTAAAVAYGIYQQPWSSVAAWVFSCTLTIVLVYRTCK